MRRPSCPNFGFGSQVAGLQVTHWTPPNPGELMAPPSPYFFPGYGSKDSSEDWVFCFLSFSSSLRKSLGKKRTFSNALEQVMEAVKLPV